MHKLLNTKFLKQTPVEHVAQKLLGHHLVTNIDGIKTVGKIVELEAYCGRRDKACHAYFKRTARNEVMFAEGGVAYVYLCYGIHSLFNIVTGALDEPAGVLIRGIEPIIGEKHMLKRRGMSTNTPN